MNTFIVVMVLLIGAIFFVSLRMNMSASKDEEKKLWIASIVLIVCFAGLIWWSNKTNDFPINLLMFWLLFSYPAPKLIAQFINSYQRKSNQPVFQLSVSKPVIFKEMFSVIFYLLLTVAIFIPNIYSYTTTPDGATTVTHESTLTITNMAFVCFTLSLITLSILNIVQKVKIFDEGLFYDGRFWKWSDFTSYHSKKGSKELVLTTNRNIGLWQIELGLLPENAERVIFLLAQNIKTASES